MRTLWLMLLVVLLIVPVSSGCPGKSTESTPTATSQTATQMPEKPKPGEKPKVPIN